MLWKAPELLKDPTKGPTKEGDIYSLAIIMQEVIMRGVPFEYECKNNVDAKSRFHFRFCFNSHFLGDKERKVLTNISFSRSSY